MNKENNININFTSIVDYIRDKDFLIEDLRFKLDKYKTTLDKYKTTIDKIKELIKSSGGYKGICSQPQTDTFSYILELLEEIE